MKDKAGVDQEGDPNQGVSKGRNSAKIVTGTLCCHDILGPRRQKGAPLHPGVVQVVAYSKSPFLPGSKRFDVVSC